MTKPGPKPFRTRPAAALAKGKDAPGAGPSASSGKTAGRRPAAESAGTKELILQQAIEVISDRGLLGATVREVAQRSGLTPAMVHYHFKDRDSLIRATLDRFIRPISDSVWEAADLDVGPLEMLREFHLRLQSVSRVPWYASLWSRELGCIDGHLREYMRSLVDPARLRAFRDKIEEGQRQGLINPVLVPELVFGTLIAIIFMPRLIRSDWSRLWRKDITEEMLSRHVWGTIIDGLAAKDGDKIR
ncbi:MAG: TetR/AcrR family transcriptional regulator [Deltaproteobacteria bacterium]|jgi:AcrR family transcriptional regulator|nr:TetR/AcrR family transcriptional regulator [Deltaproteobacteria bacterium]